LEINNTILIQQNQDVIIDPPRLSDDIAYAPPDSLPWYQSWDELLEGATLEGSTFASGSVYPGKV